MLRSNPDEAGNGPGPPPNEGTSEGAAQDRGSRSARIDQICDAFEQDWRRGSQPDLSDYLHRASPDERNHLFCELVLVERELLGVEADPPGWNEYRARFPNFAQQIEALRISHFDQATVAPQESKQTATAPADFIGRFELHELLGRGGMGEVWRAYDPRLQRWVALKRPLARHLSEESLVRFLREARAAARLAHPNIVPIHEVEREGHTPYIVSKYIDGGDLRDWMADAQRSSRQAAEVCRTVAEALHHAHEQGVVHRDLKPANVLIDKAGQPFVTDFGLAKLAADTNDLTVTGQLVGTPNYMSPEQARGESHLADRRTDVYALGAMLYEMLVGRPPFLGEPHSVTERIIRDEPAAPRSVHREIPRDLETICLKALEKDPARRYPTAQEMSVDLRRFLEYQPILARRTGPVERSWRWIKRRPLVAAMILVALLAAGSLAMWTRVSAENFALHGWRDVSITTEPPGARVVFVKLDDASGEPDPQQITRPSGRSPVQVALKPGDYLVVAALDDGRFHEVYRQVRAHGASSLEAIKSAVNTQPDGTIILTTIHIPLLSVSDDMVFVPCPDLATARETRAGQSPGFYIDRDEMRITEFNELLFGPRAAAAHDALSSDGPATPSFDYAGLAAEKRGKRLPSEAEFECAADFVSAIGDRSGHSTTGKARDGREEIIALLNGVGEWTTTRNFNSLPGTIAPGIIPLAPQIVRGGPVSTSAATDDPRFNRISVNRTNSAQSIGFRCVRSATPRFLD